ncbi:hypothetical protein ABZS66_12095 [Dactylosporangium sp. NPDC005572]|uniref:hypothetical protein n=1 Tax=Dactylosporangium sp. NPDC005572 TaxID=3156889 RepID=UPI0033BC7C92
MGTVVPGALAELVLGEAGGLAVVLELLAEGDGELAVIWSGHATTVGSPTLTGNPDLQASGHRHRTLRRSSAPDRLLFVIVCVFDKWCNERDGR